MADIVADAKTRVAWVTTISNKAAPTTTELNAGIDLSMLVTADGLTGFKADTARVDTTAVGSDFDTERTGRASFGGATMVRLKKQDTGDSAYTTMVRRATGYIVIRKSVARTTAWTAGQAVQVFPAECGETGWVDFEPNSLERYEVPIALTDEPSLRATVA